MKKIIFYIICSLSLTFYGQIPQDFFGINHWMPRDYKINPGGAPNGPIENTNIQTMVKDAGAYFVRIGGIDYDKFGHAIGIDETDNDYINAIKSVRDVNPNAKFLIQVPTQNGFARCNAPVKPIGRFEQ